MAVDWSSIWQGIGQLGQTKARGAQSLAGGISGFGQGIGGGIMEMGKTRQRREDVEQAQAFTVSEREAGELFKQGEDLLAWTRGNKSQEDQQAHEIQLEALVNSWRERATKTALNSAEQMQADRLQQELDMYNRSQDERERAAGVAEGFEGQRVDNDAMRLSAALSDLDLGNNIGNTFEQILALPNMAGYLKGVDEDGYAVTKYLWELGPDELSAIEAAFKQHVMSDYAKDAPALLELFKMYAGAQQDAGPQTTQYPERDNLLKTLEGLIDKAKPKEQSTWFNPLTGPQRTKSTVERTTPKKRTPGLGGLDFGINVGSVGTSQASDDPTPVIVGSDVDKLLILEGMVDKAKGVEDPVDGLNNVALAFELLNKDGDITSTPDDLAKFKEYVRLAKDALGIRDPGIYDPLDPLGGSR